MRYWLFQANPEKYDITTALKNMKTIPWALRQHSGDVLPGDRALIWASGREGGVLATGTISGEPSLQGASDDEDGFVLDPCLKAPSLCAPIRIDQALNPIITRDEARSHPVLKELQVLRAPRMTVYEVTQQQWRAVERST